MTCGKQPLPDDARGVPELGALRRILVDMIEEYARHTGHADLIRESVDGLVGEDDPRDRGATSDPIAAEQLTIVPANEASWDDLAAIFGTTDAGLCQCQRFKVLGWIWRDSTLEERTAMLRGQTACGDPNASTTSGLVAYVDDEPAGWVAVEPRTAYPKLRTSRVPWSGRDEDKSDDGIWAVTCFVVRKGYRGRGLTYPLARATIDSARERGARALEAYPMITSPGKEITWGEVHVGARQVFEDAGFEEVSHPTVRRVVMRIDFEQRSDVRRRTWAT